MTEWKKILKAGLHLKDVMEELDEMIYRHKLGTNRLSMIEDINNYLKDGGEPYIKKLTLGQSDNMAGEAHIHLQAIMEDGYTLPVFRKKASGKLYGKIVNAFKQLPFANKIDSEFDDMWFDESGSYYEVDPSPEE